MEGWTSQGVLVRVPWKTSTSHAPALADSGTRGDLWTWEFASPETFHPVLQESLEIGSVTYLPGTVVDTRGCPTEPTPPSWDERVLKPEIRIVDPVRPESCASKTGRWYRPHRSRPSGERYQAPYSSKPGADRSPLVLLAEGHRGAQPVVEIEEEGSGDGAR